MNDKELHTAPTDPLEAFRRRYAPEIVDLAVNGRRFRLFKPADLDRFIESAGTVENFPLWAKVWEASLVLADHVSRQPPAADDAVLEIGAGLGLVGTVAAAFGHRVTVTEYNEDALAFAAANVLLNGCSGVEVRKLDWFRPSFTGTFRRVIGSEVVYREEDFAPLAAVFRRHLAPGGEILLSFAVRGVALRFVETLKAGYRIGVKKKTLRADGRERVIMLVRLTTR